MEKKLEITLLKHNSANLLVTKKNEKKTVFNVQQSKLSKLYLVKQKKKTSGSEKTVSLLENQVTIFIAIGKKNLTVDFNVWRLKKNETGKKHKEKLYYFGYSFGAKKIHKKNY